MAISEGCLLVIYLPGPSCLSSPTVLSWFRSPSPPSCTTTSALFLLLFSPGSWSPSAFTLQPQGLFYCVPLTVLFPCCCQGGKSKLLGVVHEAMSNLASIQFSRDISYFPTMPENTTLVPAKLYYISYPQTLHSFLILPSSHNAFSPLFILKTPVQPFQAFSVVFSLLPSLCPKMSLVRHSQC